MFLSLFQVPYAGYMKKPSLTYWTEEFPTLIVVIVDVVASLLWEQWEAEEIAESELKSTVLRNWTHLHPQLHSPRASPTSCPQSSKSWRREGGKGHDESQKQWRDERLRKPPRDKPQYFTKKSIRPQWAAFTKCAFVHCVSFFYVTKRADSTWFFSSPYIC